MRNIEEKILDKINGNVTGIWQLSQRDRVQVDEVSKKCVISDFSAQI